jgi:hypothetical protein
MNDSREVTLGCGAWLAVFVLIVSLGSIVTAINDVARKCTVEARHDR